MNEAKQRKDEVIMKLREEIESKSPLELIVRECEDSVKNVTLSDETKALLICKAKLSDLFNSLSDIYELMYSLDLPKDVDDSWNKLDKAITLMIADSIEYMLSNNKYLIM